MSFGRTHQQPRRLPSGADTVFFFADTGTTTSRRTLGPTAITTTIVTTDLRACMTARRLLLRTCGVCGSLAPNFSSQPEGDRVRKKDGANFCDAKKDMLVNKTSIFGLWVGFNHEPFVSVVLVWELKKMAPFGVDPPGPLG